LIGCQPLRVEPFLLARIDTRTVDPGAGWQCWRPAFTALSAKGIRTAKG